MKLEKSHAEQGKTLSYCELNLETWRQLWRVLEISDIILVIVDARYPVSLPTFPQSIRNGIIDLIAITEFAISAFIIRIRHANAVEAYDFGAEQNRFGAIAHCAGMETLFRGNI